MMITRFLLSLSLSLIAFSEIAPEKLEAAKKLSDAMGMRDQMMSGFDAMLPLIEQQATALSLTDEQKAGLLEVYRTWFSEDFNHDKLVLEMLKMYAKSFTVEELTELTAFYQTPLGQKTLLLMPELTAKGAELGMLEGQAAGPMLNERIQEFMTKIKEEKK